MGSRARPDQKERLCGLHGEIFPYIAREAISWPVLSAFRPRPGAQARREGSSDAEDRLPFTPILFGWRQHGQAKAANLNGQANIKAISDFSRAVPQIVEREYHNESLCAGGDDVLAPSCRRGA